MKRRLQKLPRWLLLLTTAFSLGIATIPQAASAATPTVKASMHVSDSARVGVCTATITVRWSNFTAPTDAFVRISGLYGQSYGSGDQHFTPTGSRGSYKATFTVPYDATTTDTVVATGGIYQSPDWVTDDSNDSTVHCGTGWSVQPS